MSEFQQKQNFWWAVGSFENKQLYPLIILGISYVEKNCSDYILLFGNILVGGQYKMNQ